MSDSTRFGGNDARRLERLRTDPAWIADETDPTTKRTLARIRRSSERREEVRDPALARILVLAATAALAIAAAVALGGITPALPNG